MENPLSFAHMSQQRRERDQGYRKVKTGMHPSQIGFRVDFIAQTARLACILNSSLSRTNNLRVKRSQLHDSGHGSGALFGHSTHHSET